MKFGRFHPFVWIYMPLLFIWKVCPLGASYEHELRLPATYNTYLQLFGWLLCDSSTLSLCWTYTPEQFMKLGAFNPFICVDMIVPFLRKVCPLGASSMN